MNRVLLDDFPSSNDKNLEFDILNQHTYDGYDWFLYAFSIFVLGYFCLCCGWCAHKKYVSDKIIDDKDIEDLETPISPSGAVERKYSFNGFNIFGEDIAPKNKHENSYNEQVLSQTVSPTLISTVSPPQIPSNTNSEIDMTPMSSFNLTAPNTKRVTLSNSSIRESQFNMLYNANTPTMDNDISRYTVTTTPVIYETNNAIVLQMPIQPEIQEVSQSNIDQQKRVSVPRISIPPKNIDIIPQYKDDTDTVSPKTAGIDGVASPDSCEPSESHLSIDISYDGGTPSKNGSYPNYDHIDQPQHKRVITAPIGLQVIVEEIEDEENIDKKGKNKEYTYHDITDDIMGDDVKKPQ